MQKLFEKTGANGMVPTHAQAVKTALGRLDIFTAEEITDFIDKVWKSHPEFLQDRAANLRPDRIDFTEVVTELRQDQNLTADDARQWIFDNPFLLFETLEDYRDNILNPKQADKNGSAPAP